MKQLEPVLWLFFVLLSHKSSRGFITIRLINLNKAYMIYTWMIGSTICVVSFLEFIKEEIIKGAQFLHEVSHYTHLDCTHIQTYMHILFSIVVFYTHCNVFMSNVLTVVSIFPLHICCTFYPNKFA